MRDFQDTGTEFSLFQHSGFQENMKKANKAELVDIFMSIQLAGATYNNIRVILKRISRVLRTKEQQDQINRYATMAKRIHDRFVEEHNPSTEAMLEDLNKLKAMQVIVTKYGIQHIFYTLP